MENESDLTLIPTEILSLIFQRSGNLIALMATCHRFHEVITEDPRLMSRIRRYFMQGNHVEMLIYGMRDYSQMTVLIPRNFTEEVIDALDDQAHSLRQLTVIIARFTCREPFMFVPNFYVRILEQLPESEDFFVGDRDWLEAAITGRVVQLPLVNEIEIFGDVNHSFEGHIELTFEGPVIVERGEYVEPPEEVELRDQRIRDRLNYDRLER